MKNRFSFKVLSPLLVAAFATLSPAANATSTVNTLSDITIDGTNFARLAVNGPAIGGRPSCHVSTYSRHYAWDISTTKGKAMLATAQAALLAGKSVGVTGGSSCTTLVTGVTIETLTVLTIFN
jgi:hypothetical protein